MKHLTSVLLIALVLLSLLPACGTKPLLKIGLAVPFTGYDQDRGYNAIYAVKQAIAEANARGGVGGYMVELVAVDDRNDPAEAARQARELTLYPDLMGVIGHYDDECTLAAIPAYGQAGMPLVAPWLVVDREDGDGLVFRASAPARVLGGQLADASDARRLAVVTDGSPAGRDLAAAFAAGRTVVFQAQVPGGNDSRDFAPLAQQAAGAGPDAVFYGGHATGAALWLRALRDAGVTAPFLAGPDLDDPKFVRLAGTAAEGVVFVGLARPGPDGGPLGAGYRERTGRDPDERAALAYDATGLLLAAIEHAVARDGRPTRAGVTRSLREMPPYVGLTGPVFFDPTGQRREVVGVIYAVADGVPRPRSEP
jgi:branched-chain amino acid transport system substrate-binding protein